MKIKLNGIIGRDVTAEDIEKSLPKNGEDVEIEVNSDGGDVIEGFAVYNALKNYSGKVTAVINAKALSAAAYVIFAASKIKVYENSCFMIHRAWTCQCGNAVEMRECASMLEALDKIMAADYAAVTGKGTDEALAEMGKDVWLIGADAIAAHGIKCEKIDYGNAEKNVKIDEAQAKARFKAAAEKIKAAPRPDAAKKILALLKKEPAGKAGRRAKAMTKEELLKLLEANGELKNAILEWAREQLGDKADPEGSEESEPEKKEPEKEPPAENKAAAERRRVSQILALAGGKMTAGAKAAIESGQSAADFMVSQEIAARSARAKGGANTDEIGKPSVPKTFAELGGKKKDDPAAPVTDDETLRAMAKRI